MSVVRAVAAAALMLGVAAGFAGDAAAQVAEAPPRTDDPIESANRAVFDANNAVDHAVLRPAAEAYRDTVPGLLQHGVHNFLTNLREPVIGLNDLLQGNPARAWSTIWRFAVNSTAGGLGVYDMAGTMGLEHHEADFGQTLGVWGLGPGPYLTLPLLGPSSVRDAAGLAVDFALNPVVVAPRSSAASYALGGASASQSFDARVQNIDTLGDLERTSIDYYASLRSAYLQNRAALVRDGKDPGSAALAPAAPELQAPDPPGSGLPAAPPSRPEVQVEPLPPVASGAEGL